MTSEAWVVHKFGGTSVANLERYKNACTIVKGDPAAKKAVVVSAMAGVTDELHALVDLARRRDETYKARLLELEARHVGVVTSADLGPEGSRLVTVINGDFRDIADILRAIWLGKSCAEPTLELVAGYGEVWSAQILRAILEQLGAKVSWIDARDVLIVHPAEIGVAVDWEASRSRLSKQLAGRSEPWLVITGYVASTPEGVPTTLKRNGSDYSASIFGALLGSSAITIWTDVDGVLSADPRRVPEAVVLDDLSYDEAMELAYFGAKVVHPRTMAPAIDRQIPIWIRNSLSPAKRGTRIGPPARSAGPVEAGRAVKAFSTVDGVSLLNLEGSGMVGVPGVAQRLFGALREVGVSVIMISQASSEHSICFAVPERSSALAKKTVEAAFAEEQRCGQIQQLEVTAGCSILAAVGDGMVETPGVAATFFGALARAGINVRAIAQGSSERNISAVIDRGASTRALRAAHAGFYLSNQTISVGVIGPGLVGAALLRQLAQQAAALKDTLKIDLRVRAVMDSSHMALGDPTLAMDNRAELLEPPAGRPQDLEAFVEHVRAEPLPHAVIIDATASEEITDHYAGWLARGIHVITPNKRAGAGPLSRYQTIRRRARERRAHFFYEATVGAGLPVISTLRDLLQTGDRVLKIEGILSGTMSFLFAALGKERRFSSMVREAKRLGYTEPDPRDDLSGRDVARKLVILAREMGRMVELADVKVESLVPPGLESLPSSDQFLERLSDFDGEMDERLQQAAAGGNVLRYVGVVTHEGDPRVEIRSFSASHAFARVAPGDNIIAFTTTRYLTQPLIVQGPGAGPEVTAAGVFADLLRLGAYLGAAS